MRTHPTASRAVAALILFLMSAPRTLACLPAPAGLEALITGAEQAIYVEITEVAVSQSWFDLSEIRTAVVEASESVSEDLALLADAYLPKFDAPEIHFHARATVLAHLNGEGPQIGSTFTSELSHWGVQPGRRAVIFLGHRTFPFSTLGLTVLDEIDSVLVLADHEKSTDLTAVIEAGFANKRTGPVATREWLEAAVRSPTSREHLWRSGLAERLSPTVRKEALATGLTGSWSDLVLLESLNKVESADLDLLALELVTSWLQSPRVYRSHQAIHIALERWQIPISEELNAKLSRKKEENLRNVWQEITSEAGLPMAANPELDTIRASRQQMRDDWFAFRKTLRESLE